MGELDGEAALVQDRLFLQQASRVLRLKAWPYPGAAVGADRATCRTAITLRAGMADVKREVQVRDDEEKEAFKGFIRTIPLKVRHAVSAFPEFMFPMLRLVWEAKAPALELMASNPALTLAIAMSPELKTDPGLDGWKSPVELVGMKRQKILEWLEFPGGKSTVSILARVTKQALFIKHLRTLRRLLQEGDPKVRKTLGHLDHINAEVLAFLSDAKLLQHATQPFLVEMSEMHYRGAHMAARLHRVLDEYQKLEGLKKVPVFKSADELEGVIRDLDALEQTGVRRSFPAPPVPGNGNIEPLDSVAKMHAESRSQHNCAADYVGEVRSGRYYLYRMKQPERCTISLKKGKSGRWRLYEIKTDFNVVPQRDATMRVVKRWLQDHRPTPIGNATSDS